MSGVNEKSFYLHKKFKRSASTTENLSKDEQNVHSNSQNAINLQISERNEHKLNNDVDQRNSVTQELSASSSFERSFKPSIKVDENFKEETHSNLTLTTQNFVNNYPHYNYRERSRSPVDSRKEFDNSRDSPKSSSGSAVLETLTCATNIYYDQQIAPGRYICQYCQLVCNKPSVLEKHIRAHTNERPFPCQLCGFAFKTKSNLHKHYK